MMLAQSTILNESSMLLKKNAFLCLPNEQLKVSFSIEL